MDPDDTTLFNRFDVVSDDSDHYYVKTNRPLSNGDGTRVQKKIMQEWRILEKHLPDSIYARVYETRIDLLRAVIVGAAGTPYHDGLFFFDLAFPPDYPNRPPQVHYRSYGLRINPNLYASGLVCLSLLNTWSGKKTERWNPKESTVLQVLLSIQALVLNERPYFNEPGTGSGKGMSSLEKRSISYNEQVFSLSCKTMLFVLHKPPKNFEPLVKTHFRERAAAIVAACDEYRNGRTRVGYYRNDDAAASDRRMIQVSSKFKGCMRQLYPLLICAFRYNGASLENLKLEDPKTSTRSAGKKKKWGLVKSIVGTVKKVLGLKKSITKSEKSEKVEASS